MSAEWKGHLRNTASDIYFDTTLLVLTACACVPQISLPGTGTSTQGLSPFFIACNVIFSNAQLSEVLLLAVFAWPTAARPVLKQIDHGYIDGLETFGAILGILQISVQWLCSVAILISFVALNEATAPGIPILVVAHTALIVFPAIAIVLPRPKFGHSFGKDVMMALIAMSNQVVAPSSIVLQFVTQLRAFWSEDVSPGALSLFPVVLQVVTMALLGTRWLLRLGRPTWENRTAPVWLWYQWGFLSFNYLAQAVGYGLLLVCYLLVGHGLVNDDDSRIAQE